ncbi:P-loop containing nucleoside triphosphate hydrolase protein [Mycena rebaudengoi]|nr:P-loop containing nucleoside triphosphate hydrolase protein [Mycena rebaudengoi]
MVSSIWSRSSPGCIASTSRALCSRPSFSPKVSFESLRGQITPQTLNALTVKPFKLQNMTPVQAEVLTMLPELAAPYAENSGNVRDLLVRAKTGTGKTVAFLDLAQRAESDPNPAVYTRRTVGTLVISPTRELATQIANEALRLLHHHRDFELRDWMKGRKDIVVATPGRLRDLLESDPDVKAAIATTNILILDEADTLLEMGFREDIEDIKRYLPPVPQRQTLLFSATVSKEIQQVARSTLAPNHKYINCVTEEASPVHAHLPHILRLIAHDQLTNPGFSKVIIFFPTTKMTQLFSTLINALASTVLPAGKNTRVYEIHSKRTQDKRTMVSDAFRKAKGGATVLITSDVSARGVDYPNVTRVIQVGIPGGREQYIHRVGRTGRAGTAGRGDLVLLPWEIGFVTWQLTDVPLNPLAVNELTEQTTKLAAKFDENPQEFFQQSEVRSNTGVGPVLFGAQSATAIVEDIERNVGTLLGRLDEEAIRETFMSLLGYYISKSPELRVQKPIIIQGCRDWSTGACGLASPPHVSTAFLQKLGMGDGRTKHFGKTTGTMVHREKERSAPWIGRGRVATRGSVPTTSSWKQDDFDGEDSAEADEYKTPRYGAKSYGSRGGRGGGGGYGVKEEDMAVDVEEGLAVAVKEDLAVDVVAVDSAADAAAGVVVGVADLAAEAEGVDMAATRAGAVMVSHRYCNLQIWSIQMLPTRYWSTERPLGKVISPELP